MIDYLRRSDVSWKKQVNKKSSEGTTLEDYSPTVSERERHGNFKQKLKMENSYGRMSLGMAKDGTMTFVVSGRKRQDETPTAGDARRLDGSRAVQGEYGVYRSNALGSSALAYKEKIKSKHQREHMLTRITRTLEDEARQEAAQGQKAHTSGGIDEVVANQMPFLTAKKDREKLKLVKQHGTNERAALEQELQIKQRLRRDVMNSLTAAMKEQPVEDYDDEMPWWMKKLLGMDEEAKAGEDGSADSSNSSGDETDIGDGEIPDDENI